MSDFTIKAVFRGVDRLTAPIKRMQRTTDGFAKKVQRNIRNVNESFRRLGRGIKQTMTASIVGVGSLGVALADTIKVGAEFEHVLVSAGLRFPEMVTQGTKGFEELKAAAIDASATTEFTAMQYAKSIRTLAQTGFTDETTKGLLASGQLADFATAALIDLDEATFMVTKSLGGFGKLAKDDPKQLIQNLKELNNIMAFTANSFTTTVPTMFEAFRYSAPSAMALKMSMEQYFTMLGYLADAGIDATVAGTAMKNLSLKMGAPSSNIRMLMEDLGVSLKMGADGFYDYISAFEDLKKAMNKEGLSHPAQQQIIKDMFGLIPISAANIMLSKADEKMRTISKDIREIANTDYAQGIAALQRDTTKGKFDEFISVIEAVKIDMFDQIAHAIKDVTIEITNWIRANRELIASGFGDFMKYLIDNREQIVSTIKEYGKIALYTIAIVVAAKALILAVQTLTAVMTLFNPALAITNALGLKWTVIIGLIVVGIAALIYYWDDLKAATIAHWEAMSTWQKMLVVVGASLLAATLLVKGLSAAIIFLKGTMVATAAVGGGLAAVFGALKFAVVVGSTVAITALGGLKGVLMGLVAGVAVFAKAVLLIPALIVGLASAAALALEPILEKFQLLEDWRKKSWVRDVWDNVFGTDRVSGAITDEEREEWGKRSGVRMQGSTMTTNTNTTNTNTSKVQIELDDNMKVRNTEGDMGNVSITATGAGIGM